MTFSSIVKMIPKKFIILIGLMKICLSGFNVFFSIMMQLGIESVLGDFLLNQFVIEAVSMVGGSIFYILLDYWLRILLKQFFKVLTYKISESFIYHTLSSEYIIGALDEGKVMTIISNDFEIISNYFEFGFLPLLDMIFTLILGVMYIARYRFAEFDYQPSFYTSFRTISDTVYD